MRADPDIVVIGSGPNGLVAACRLAGEGLRVLVLEANDTVGGGARTAELTLPGFRHDLCSAFHPLARVGPISDLPLAEHGLAWCHSPRPYGGATPDGSGIALGRSLEESAALFDRAAAGDGDGWRELLGWWEWGGPAFLNLLFNPIGHPAPLLRGAPLLARPRRLVEFGQLMGSSAAALVGRAFRGEDARIWLTGSVLHSDLSPDDAGGAAFGLMLCGLAQRVGMPIPRGGAGAITAALTRLLEARGGQVLTGRRATRIVVRAGRAAAVRAGAEEFAARRGVLATVEPQGLFLDLVGAGHLPDDFVELARRFRWGTGVFTLHCALGGLPDFRAEALHGTLAFHLGRSVAELRTGVADARNGTLPAHPLLIAGIHTLVDPSRAPDGRHTLWAMAHVPSRILADAGGTIRARTWREAKAPFLERLLDEIEAYAPGFRRLVLASEGHTPEELQARNANLVGGDIGSGSYMLDQQLVFRPLPGWFRYKTPIRGLYMGGASTHPGGGVHGAAGANAARVLLTDLRLGEAVGPVSRAGSRLSGAARSYGGRAIGRVERSATRVQQKTAGLRPDSAEAVLPSRKGRTLALWRFGRGWPAATMRAYLEELRGREVNFDLPPDEMTEANGWTVDGADAPIGVEPPGPPLPGGHFARAKQGLIDYEFSDRRIVLGHFDPRAPLEGRNMLLELKVLGLRYLNGVRVSAVRDESDGHRTSFGFRYDTLEGHIEQGYEWFLLSKNHESGQVRFRIEAHWRLGQFPNWWSRVGFWLIGARLRELWRRRAVAHLRSVAGRRAPAMSPAAQTVSKSGGD